MASRQALAKGESAGKYPTLSPAAEKLSVFEQMLWAGSAGGTI